MKHTHESQSDNVFYKRVWRWHFLAGLYVIPFFMMLALTGMVMVITHLNESKFGEKLYLDDVSQLDRSVVSAQAHLTSAQSAFPNAVLSQYIPSFQDNKVALVQMDSESGTLLVSINPYTNELVGSLNKNETLYYWANAIHGSLLLGDTGDFLIELAASLGIVMLVTGIYLWLPRDRHFLAAISPFSIFKKQKRETIKALHSTLAFYISLILLFFLISGLAWTNIWGGKFVQAWSTFPAEKSAPAGMKAQGGHHGAVTTEAPDKKHKDVVKHAALNHGAMKEVPWGLEQSVLPASDIHVHSQNIGIDKVYILAKDLGFNKRFRINLPKNAEGVYTISANSMVGDIDKPHEERTVHIDQYTGEILADVKFSDYSFAAKSMAIGIALHQGEFGWWNAIVNLIFCMLVLVLCLTGIWMWWLRRPQQQQLSKLGVPQVGKVSQPITVESVLLFVPLLVLPILWGLLLMMLLFSVFSLIRVKFGKN